jgi:hypothetical protein
MTKGERERLTRLALRMQRGFLGDAELQPDGSVHEAPWTDAADALMELRLWLNKLTPGGPT